MGIKQSGTSIFIGAGTSYNAMNGNGDVALQISQTMQGGATMGHGMATIVVNTAERSDNPNSVGKSSASKMLGKVAFPLAIWGVGNDIVDGYNQYNGSFGNIKISTALTLQVMLWVL